MTTQTPVRATIPSIKQIKVDNLFGYLNYTIPQLASPSTDRLLLLYGENGVGKTTLLRLTFSLLTSSQGGGYKGYLAKTIFNRLEVHLTNDITVVAEREGETTVGPYVVKVSNASGVILTLPILPEPDLKVSRVKNHKIDELLNLLASICPNISFLSDDRRFQRSRTPQPNVSLASATATTTTQDQPAIVRVISQVNSWLRSKWIAASSTGEDNAQSIYLRVIGEIAGVPGHTQLPEDLSIGYVQSGLEQLAKSVQHFNRYGLISPVPTDRFAYIISQAQSDETKNTIARVLQPYLSGVAARMNALEELQHIISTYIETVNEFLVYKRITFTPQRGLKIFSQNDTILDPEYLSSGERQLIVLLTRSILAWDSGGIFLVDEPELSLNVTWQRKLIEALLRCSSNYHVQYVMASHSLEIISQHLESVIRLGPQ